MKEFHKNISQWIEEKKTFAIATVIQAWGSSPRPIGSAMIVSEDLEMMGSVSGGCVEGQILREAQTVLMDGQSKRLAYGITDENAWSVGLSCGGKMQVFLEDFTKFEAKNKAIWTALQMCFQNDKGCILVRKIEEGASEYLLIYPNGTTVGTTQNDVLIQEGLSAYKERKSQVFTHNETAYFAQIFPKKDQLLIVGAAHITVDLLQLAKLYDFETVLIDPRKVFAEKTQFTIPPDQLLIDYPSEVLSNFDLDAYTYAVILSHDPKIDDNALHVLLKSNIGYIGALGSRKTHAKRVARLQEAGFDEKNIARIYAPIGLDIRAKKPKEIALSIMAELVKVRNVGS